MPEKTVYKQTQDDMLPPTIPNLLTYNSINRIDSHNTTVNYDGQKSLIGNGNEEDGRKQIDSLINNVSHITNTYENDGTTSTHATNAYDDTSPTAEYATSESRLSTITDDILRICDHNDNTQHTITDSNISTKRVYPKYPFNITQMVSSPSLTTSECTNTGDAMRISAIPSSNHPKDSANKSAVWANARPPHSIDTAKNSSKTNTSTLLLVLHINDQL